MGRVEGEIVIVSGGPTGLGESHVRTLVGEGARALTEVWHSRSSHPAGLVSAQTLI